MLTPRISQTKSSCHDFLPGFSDEVASAIAPREGRVALSLRAHANGATDPMNAAVASIRVLRGHESANLLLTTDAALVNAAVPSVYVCQLHLSSCLPSLCRLSLP
jgi:hypothetical protein